MCFLFFNSHKFSLTRETDTKKAEQFFKDSILSYTQKNMAIWQSLCFGQFFIISELKFCKIADLFMCVNFPSEIESERIERK